MNIQVEFLYEEDDLELAPLPPKVLVEVPDFVTPLPIVVDLLFGGGDKASYSTAFVNVSNLVIPQEVHELSKVNNVLLLDENDIEMHGDIKVDQSTQTVEFHSLINVSGTILIS